MAESTRYSPDWRGVRRQGTLEIVIVLALVLLSGREDGSWLIDAMLPVERLKSVWEGVRGEA